jgi:hypothetical protein
MWLIARQSEFDNAHQSLGPLVHFLPLLLHHVPRGLWPHQVGVRRVAHSELFVFGLIARYVGVHDYRRGVESVHARLVSHDRVCPWIDANTYFSAVSYPRCTNSSALDPDSDCGSIGWSFTLFIAWNLLSMVRFRNGVHIQILIFQNAVHLREHVHW